jgi:antitoxin VapB
MVAPQPRHDRALRREGSIHPRQAYIRDSATALYIKDPEVDRLARELAQVERVTLTETVKGALAARLEAVEERRERRRRKVAALLEEVRKLPVLDPRGPDEVLYDKDGLPIG